MQFADSYLSKQEQRYLFNAPELPKMKIIVVIPSYNEPAIEVALTSLIKCENPGVNVGVIVVINSSDTASDEALRQNDKTQSTVNEIVSQCTLSWLHIYSINVSGLNSKHAGAGWARKLGMDWAVTHFNFHNEKRGVILSFDADSRVDENYLVAVNQFFKTNKKCVAATLNFEHALSGVDHSAFHYQGITLYELYLRYFKNALGISGFPHSIYTIGSCMAVLAEAYSKQGGMNRKQAGEDFYFLHKLTSLGSIGEINTTTVYPSSRESDRVIFGTGAALRKWNDGSDELHFAYPLASFIALNQLFENVDLLYNIGEVEFSLFLSKLHPSLANYLTEIALYEEIDCLSSNCGNVKMFAIRFFQIFNALKILKWLNYSLENGFNKNSLVDEVLKLMHLRKIEVKNCVKNPVVLLMELRNFDKFGN